MKNKLIYYGSSIEQVLDNYERACQWVAIAFVRKYFGKKILMSDWFSWVGDRIGQTLMVGDYFFDMNEMVEALDKKIKVKDLFEKYDDDIEKATQSKGSFFTRLINKIR